MTDPLCDTCFHTKDEHGSFCSGDVVISDGDDNWDYYNCECTGYIPEDE